ncbi:protein lifeguard 1-like [Tropilaelaps mercedesae]|uniref:Protein lifeguard 1-like n=1 Tax=Tropilaelaps mercedesae TaxID=418985 RepID=A0A1V9Y121_9ACAR|nr:protein lifeguard 1-like [Tropilaelaps mercedesae]
MKLFIHYLSTGSDGGLVGTGFSSKDIRMAFVRKVYTILFIQLAVTTAFIGVFIYTKEVNLWVLANPGATLGAYITFIILYLVLICCEHVRRQHPTNVVLLGIFTCALSYMVGVISCTYKTESVLLAFGICAVCCLAVTLFSFNTKYDFTSCAGILFVAAIAFMIFGFIMIFFRTEVMHKVYAGVGALLFMLFLAFDTQMIMGGKKLEISPEEYVFASIQLYMDIVQIFLFLLQLFGERK